MLFLSDERFIASPDHSLKTPFSRTSSMTSVLFSQGSSWSKRHHNPGKPVKSFKYVPVTKPPPPNVWSQLVTPSAAAAPTPLPSSAPEAPLGPFDVRRCVPRDQPQPLCKYCRRLPGSAAPLF